MVWYYSVTFTRTTDGLIKEAWKERSNKWQTGDWTETDQSDGNTALLKSHTTKAIWIENWIELICLTSQVFKCDVTFKFMKLYKNDIKIYVLIHQ